MPEKNILSLFVYVGLISLSMFFFEKHVTAQDLVVYSDTWLDDETGYTSNPENQEYYVVGGGVVEIMSDYYHSYDATMTIESPQSRTFTASASCSDGCNGTSLTTIAPIPLEIGSVSPDVGQYQARMQIHPECSGGGTILLDDSFPLGITFIGMQLVLGQPPNPTGYFYEKVQPCNVYCGAPQTNYTPGPPVGCIQLQIPFGPFGCSAVVRVVKGVQACICYDVGWN